MFSPTNNMSVNVLIGKFSLPFSFSLTSLPLTVGFTSPQTDSLAAQPTTTGPVVYVRPAVSSFSFSGMGFSEYLKARLSWQCDPCLLLNKVTDNKCITCHSTKLPPSDTSQQTGIGTPCKRGRFSTNLNQQSELVIVIPGQYKINGKQ